MHQADQQIRKASEDDLTAVAVEVLSFDAGGRPVEARRQRSLHLRKRLVGADVAAGFGAGAVGGLFAGVPPVQIVVYTLLMAAVWPAAAFLCGLRAREDLRSWASGVGEAPKLVLTCLALSWPLLGLLVLAGAPNATAGALATTVATAAFAAFARAAARINVHGAPEFEQPTLIVGSGDVATRLVGRLRHHPELGLRPIGFVDDSSDGMVEGLPNLGGLDALDELLRAGRVDRVIVAFTRGPHEDLLNVLRTCRDAGVAVDVVPRLFEFLDGARTMDQIGGLPLLSIDVPHFSRASQISKRALDVVLASIMLVVLSPLLALVVLGIKLESRGPVLFRQARVGRHGKRFEMLKFRSMYRGADARKPSLLESNDLRDGVMFKLYDDPRVTRVGKVIRRFSLDEVPQLINVVRGDMSLVGPRPLVLAEALAMEHAWQDRRLDLRPGLTGPWQVAGRSHIPFQEMVRFDYQYVAGWSLARDVEILLATIPAVLSGRGAY